jgi:16S rRNA (cytosine1402-N4)-methyltransferase
MVAEVLDCLRPRAGEIAVDCTLGGGGHARAILERVRPAGRVIGLDVDPMELPRAEAHLRAAGFGPDVFVARHANFAGLPHALAVEGLVHVDVILADLGVSSMQIDNPDRGFSYKGAGPLDMRLNPLRGESAAQLVARSSEAALAALLAENADEPHAEVIARLLKTQVIETTDALERIVRLGLAEAHPQLSKIDTKMSVRRTFQALRIAVNDELGSLQKLMALLPEVLAAGGRAAVISFHSLEDRLVKQAFSAWAARGTGVLMTRKPITPTADEAARNPRSRSAKLRGIERTA